MEIPQDVQCPWCGEMFTTFLDLSVADQTYIEDCQVCCRPIELNVSSDAESGMAEVIAGRS